jgi:hypoxanthine phosphoribosyltransferase
MPKPTVQVFDKTFELFIPESQIQQAIDKLADQMNKDLAGKDVIFMGILNGAFIFAADLYRRITVPSIITFVKVAYYAGTSSTGKVERLIGVNENIENMTVVILEDIIDTGVTMEYIIKQLRGYEPKEILLATMFFKKEAFKKNYPIHYIGMEIPNKFIVGYGLDYNGYGRNLKDVYILSENQ